MVYLTSPCTTIWFQLCSIIRYEGAQERRSKILEIIRSLDLPNNPLDDIIDQVVLQSDSSVLLVYIMAYTVNEHLLLTSPLVEFKYWTLNLGPFRKLRYPLFFLFKFIYLYFDIGIKELLDITILHNFFFPLYFLNVMLLCFLKSWWTLGMTKFSKGLYGISDF